MTHRVRHRGLATLGCLDHSRPAQAIGGAAGAAWIAGPASGCRPIHSPSFSKSGWPVSGSGLRSRVKSRKSSGVRTKKTREPSGLTVRLRGTPSVKRSERAWSRASTVREGAVDSAANTERPAAAAAFFSQTTDSVPLAWRFNRL